MVWLLEYQGWQCLYSISLILAPTCLRTNCCLNRNPGYHAFNVDTDLMLEVDLMCMDKQLLRVDEEIVPTCLVVCSTNGSVVGYGLCFDARKEFQSD